MKTFATLFLFFSITLGSKAGGPYRNYLHSKVYTMHAATGSRVVESNPSLNPAAFIPHFERPKGAIFCRMEDKVTKATKVWLKIGVQ